MAFGGTQNVHQIEIRKVFTPTRLHFLSVRRIKGSDMLRRQRGNVSLLKSQFISRDEKGKIAETPSGELALLARQRLFREDCPVQVIPPVWFPVGLQTQEIFDPSNDFLRLLLTHNTNIVPVVGRRIKSKMTHVVIGTNLRNGQSIFIDPFARARSTYAIGKTGTGKSTILEQLAHQDMVNGDGLLFLDPHGDSAERLLERVPEDRVPDVVFWDPFDIDHPIGLNPFQLSNPADRLAVTRKADNFVAALASLKEFAPIFETAPRMKNVLHNLAITFVANQGHSLIETPQFLVDEGFRRQFYPALELRFGEVLAFWMRFDRLGGKAQMELVESSLNKLERFPTNPVIEEIFSRPTAIDFRKAMDDRKINIVTLTGSGIEDTAAFVGAFIIWEVLEAARSRADLPEAQRRPFHIFADEFQTYMTTAFPIILEQARKYGIDATIAHQVREQLDPDLRERVRGVGNLIVFRVTRPNAESLAGEFKLEPPEPPVLRYEPKYEIVPNVLQHLAAHGHTDAKVMLIYSEVVDCIDALLLNAHHMIPLHANPAQLNLSLRRERFEHNINGLLYAAMRSAFDPDSELRKIDWASADLLGIKNHARRQMWYMLLDLFAGLLITNDYEWTLIEIFETWYKAILRSWEDAETVVAGRERICRECVPEAETPDQALDVLFKLLQKTNDPDVNARWDTLMSRLDAYEAKHRFPEFPRVTDMPNYKSRPKSHWDTVVEIQGTADVLCVMLGTLAARLRKNPCYTQSGELETRLEPSRLYSDLEMEMANRLTNLVQFHAYCKLDTESRIENFEIITQKLEAPGNPERAVEIKLRSQEMYGSAQPTRSQFGTIKSNEEEEDDEPVFGEKKTETRVETR